MLNDIANRLSADRRLLALLILVAVAARCFTFGNPNVYVDEDFYYVAARMMGHGHLPYIDVWDRKPFGLFLVYLPAGLFAPPAGIWIYQMMALAAAVTAAWLIARIAQRLGWGAGAWIAAPLYLLWLDLADGQGGQAPVFYNPLVAGAALLVCKASVNAIPTRQRRRLGLIAMALLGLALQIKYSVVFEGAFMGLWLLWREWKAERNWPALIVQGALMAGLALLPTALVWAFYAAIGQSQAFLYANFTSILQRHTDTISERLENVSDSATILALVLPFALPAFWLGGTETAGGERNFMRGWLVAAVFGFLAFGSWFNHYTLPVMVPAAVAAAALFSRPRWRLLFGIPALALLFLAGQIILRSENSARGSAAEFDAIAQAVGKGPEPLYVYAGPSMLYATSGRPVLTRYLFPTHLFLAREAGATGVDQAAEVGRILNLHPPIIVMQDRAFDYGERREIRWLVRNYIRLHGYQAMGPFHYGRHDTVTVYRLPGIRNAQP